MPASPIYKPIQFFLITFVTWSLGFAAAYLSYYPGNKGIQFLCMLAGLLGPCVAALILIYGSGNRNLVRDFWNRLSLRTIKSSFIPILLLLMPCTVLIATLISVKILGHSNSQFLLSHDFNVFKGHGIMGMFFLFLAPFLEELGWRGYGIDSLRSKYDLFITTLIFFVIIALWHLPLFFMKGYYQYQLWQTSYIYVANFVISMLPVTILLNWIFFKNNRSISAVILMHGMLNLFSVIFQTEQSTKCIITILLLMVSFFILGKDKDLFFAKNQDY